MQNQQRVHIIFIYAMVISLCFAIQINNSTITRAYWGEGDDDCIAEHGISHHYGTWVESPNIVIDGVANESAWFLPNVYEYTIPMANERDSPNFFISFMYCKYIYDANYLYIRATWNDSTSESYNDMAMWCWDINCSDYSSKMLSDAAGMKTQNPGERVDTWQFVKADKINGTVSTLLDRCFDDQDWLPYDNKETQYGFNYGLWRNPAMNYYQLEMRRPLKTAEIHVDIQFEEETPVRFSTAVCDALENQERAISWTYDLNLTHNPQPDIYGKPKPTDSTQKPTEEPTTPSNNTIFYIGSGVAVGAIILMATVIKHKKRVPNNSL
jgi:hypothetical protein